MEVTAPKTRRGAGRPPRAHPTLRVSIYIDERLAAKVVARARDRRQSRNGYLVSLVCEDLNVEARDYGHEV